jgi:disulfide bond formation protein DsbB
MTAPSDTTPLTALPAPHRAALAAFLLALLAIGGAWYSQLVWDLAPCELCLLERWPYYVGLPVLVAAILALWAGVPRAGRALLGFAALIFLAGAVLGAYHAGVEWKFWPGPAACTGHYSAGGSNDDFLKSLESTQAVRCDAAAIRILGLSLAGWNAVVSIAVAVLAMMGARAGRRR